MGFFKNSYLLIFFIGNSLGFLSHKFVHENGIKGKFKNSKKYLNLKILEFTVHKEIKKNDCACSCLCMPKTMSIDGNIAPLPSPPKEKFPNFNTKC